MSLTVHCLVKNEDKFVFYAIKSVVNFVEKLIIFDTGSTDQTISVLENLTREYPGKIIFEKKGPCDKKQHTQLRQEMLGRTTTEWFMVLDGDEIWTKKAIEEALFFINKDNTDCLIAPFYLCVGDIFHRHYKAGSIKMLGKTDFFYPRFFRIASGIHWSGDYDQDAVYNSKGELFFNKKNTVILKNLFWHTTHLIRSSVGDAFSSGGIRSNKVINTYFLVGRKIKENIPEVFNLANQNFRLSKYRSFVNFFSWFFRKVLAR